MIIDFHCHTSDKQMHGLHTSSASLDAIRAAAKKFNIKHTVLLATYFPLKRTGVHNHDLLERAGNDKRFLVFGSLDVMNSHIGGTEELQTLAESDKIAGIKLYPGYQGFEPGDTRLDGVYALAEEYGLPIMMHGGELHHCCPKEKRASTDRPCKLASCALDGFIDLAHPKYVRKPALLHPNIKFVISHLANPHFEDLREVMRECPNVYTDISGQFVSGTDEDTEEYRQEIAKEIKQFLALPNGTQRVLFATDFPIQSHEASLDLIHRLELNEQDHRNLLWSNALHVLDRTCPPWR